MTRAAIYCRVSSDRQAREGDSIPAQLDALRKYAQEHNYAIVGEYVDDGISGTRSDRDELQRLLSDIDQIDIILVTKLDRLYRSIKHYLNMMDVLDAHGVGWKAIWESYDTTTPQGRLIVNQMMSFAQFEAENTGQRIRQVFAYKAQRGEVLSGSTPPGYRIQNKRLVPSETAESVRTAFREYSRTGSLNATLLACSGLPGLPRTKPPFKRMLQNRVYIGERYGKSDYCEPLVDRQLFEDVQRQLSINVKASQKHIYIFSGLLRCAECGASLGGNIRRRKRGNGRQEEWIQYRCPKHYQRKPAACSNPKIIYEHILEADLMSQLKELIGDELLRYEVESAPIRDRTEQRKGLERKISRLKDLYLNELITLEEYRHDKQELEAQLQELTDPVPERDLSALKWVLSEDIEELYWDFSPAEKRRFWRAIIKEIRWSADRSTEVIFL